MANITLSGMLSSTDNVVQQFLSQTYPALASAVSAPIYYLSVIYVAWTGYQVYSGHAPLNGKILLQKICVISFAMMALNWGTAASMIYGMFTLFAEGAASTILAGQPTTTMFDALQTNVNQLLTSIIKGSAWDAFAIILTCVVALIINGCALIVALANMVLAKVGLAIVMLLLPLFLCFLFFDSTRQWFSNWLNMMLNFCLIYIITTTVLRFGFLLFADAINEINSTAGAVNVTVVTVQQVISIAVMQGILTVFLVQVRSLAAALSSGAVTEGSRAVDGMLTGANKGYK